MTQTTNEYTHPLDPVQFRMTLTESPAHINQLQFAVDFICPKGTTIRAALDGVVVDVKDNSTKGGENPTFDSEGNYIEIKHANGEFSIYEHIRKNGSLVKVGDVVKTGQIIGYSGATGWIAQIGPHLHFDVHTYFGPGSNDYQTLEIKWKER